MREKNKIVKAERAVYGLKQSSWQGVYHATDMLVENGFEQCKADQCVFRKVVDVSRGDGYRYLRGWHFGCWV